MGSIIETTLISLDGQVDEPMRFAAPYFDADAQGEAAEVLQANDAVVLGRRTYEAFSEAWAGQTGAFADRLNAMPKYVVSSTLTKLTWSNARVVAGDPVAAVRLLKEQHERGLAIYGHGRLSRTLLAGGLTDRVRFNLHPVVVGGPGRSLQDDTGAFTLISARRRGSGVVVLDYRIKN